MKILVTRKIPAALLKPLNELPNAEIVMFEKEDEPMPYERLVEELKTADAVFSNLSDKLDKHALEQAHNLKVISTLAVGFDNIDLEVAKAKGIKIGHTPYVLTEATADLTFALLLAVARNLPQGQQMIKNDQWKSWSPFGLTGKQVYGSKIGIIGMGRIGLSVARRAKGFSMAVFYHNRNRHEEAEKEVGATYCQLDELLEQSDFVVLLAPGSKSTYRMLGKEQFKKMKNTAYLINSSRGTNVDEQALYEALKSGEIKGAGLDVFEKEPISAEHPLLELDNVLAIPHIGSASVETREEMVQVTITNIINGLTNKELVYEVPNS
ncbi:2-hydroxyacid dehydrogenase [Alkalihalobacillus pseudalcaliphilus]|uniref:2-hydroxyacid dehydrogenase n=1 Tax=Alkalihalobacillus pseudalcaliphilus TaxID=79884 RepID=UPI00064D8633|nr:D-glycerate dehydrogenase [Alkalihalobacillus pseudalcaliphilus]KMK77769.1 2-ketogluconate reductase [Alkalihalobacillus pseudalcaliphilus]